MQWCSKAYFFTIPYSYNNIFFMFANSEGISGQHTYLSHFHHRFYKSVPYNAIVAVPFYEKSIFRHALGNCMKRTFTSCPAQFVNVISMQSLIIL